MAARCFRKELRREILAFATRIASALVGFCFGGGRFCDFPSDGRMGSTGVVTPVARLTGCIVIGPVNGFSSGMSR
jgi:hypothetical protein